MDNTGLLIRRGQFPTVNDRPRDLLVFDSSAWSSVCLFSTDVTFDNHKSVSWNIADDGLDIVGIFISLDSPQHLVL